MVQCVTPATPRVLVTTIGLVHSGDRLLVISTLKRSFSMIAWRLRLSCSIIAIDRGRERPDLFGGKAGTLWLT